MEERGGMRAADADRQATAERLRVALEEGRLDLHEYDDRLLRAYQAKTYAELELVLADLPAPTPAERAAVVPAPAATRPSAPAPDGGGEAAEAGRGHGRLLGVWSPWLRVAGILTAIWLFASVTAGHVNHYWPGWVIGPWGVLLLMRTAGDLGRRPRRGGRGRTRADR